jgi:hypothetical protein
MTEGLRPTRDFSRIMPPSVFVSERLPEPPFFLINRPSLPPYPPRAAGPRRTRRRPPELPHHY